MAAAGGGTFTGGDQHFDEDEDDIDNILMDLDNNPSTSIEFRPSPSLPRNRLFLRYTRTTSQQFLKGLNNGKFNACIDTLREQIGSGQIIPLPVFIHTVAPTVEPLMALWEVMGERSLTGTQFVHYLAKNRYVEGRMVAAAVRMIDIANKHPASVLG